MLIENFLSKRQINRTQAQSLVEDDQCAKSQSCGITNNYDAEQDKQKQRFRHYNKATNKMPI